MSMGEPVSSSYIPQDNVTGRDGGSVPFEATMKQTNPPFPGRVQPFSSHAVISLTYLMVSVASYRNCSISVLIMSCNSTYTAGTCRSIQIPCQTVSYKRSNRKKCWKKML
jgi:hypothetical protein